LIPSARQPQRWLIHQCSFRHLFHEVRPKDCALDNESPDHHLLKLELAMAARAGWRAELEVSSEARNWRADVMGCIRQGEVEGLVLNGHGRASRRIS